MNKCLQKITLVLLLCLGAFVAKANDPDTASADEGKQLFQEQCAACHNVNVQATGPALANVDQRHTFDWIYSFVKSSQTMVKHGDKQAVALFGKFQVVMPDHPGMTQDQVKDILSYIKSATKVVAVNTTPFDRPAVMPVAHFMPLSMHKNMGFFASYLVTILLLIIVLLFAVKVKDIERGAK